MTYLRYGCCENDNFVKFTNSLHERIHTWSLDHIYIVILAFNFYRNGEIGLMEDLYSGQYGRYEESKCD